MPKRLILATLAAASTLTGAANAGTLLVRNHSDAFVNVSQPGHNTIEVVWNHELRLAQWGTNCATVQPKVINYGPTTFCAPETGTNVVDVHGSLFGLWYTTDHWEHDVAYDPKQKGTKVIFGGG